MEKIMTAANALWKKVPSEYESSAKVVDGNLIISLPDAVNPIVWRMELGSVKASAMEVKTNAADGTFMLSLKTPKGESHDIAPFDHKDLAVRALMRVSAALQNAEGRMNAAPAGTTIPFPERHIAASQKSSDGSPLKWLIALGGVLIVIALFSYLAMLTVPVTVQNDSVGTSITGEQNAESGVPQSADQMLQGF